MIKTEGDVVTYFCDRCGSNFATEKKDEKPDLTDFGVKRGTYFMVPLIEDGDVIRFSPKHLCGECTRSFYNWFKRT